MSNSTKKLSFWEKTGYGCGDLASVLFWQNITLYLLIFYTDTFGLSAIAAGTMIAVSRILDAIFDVGIGMVADRTNTKWGKFRPFIMWGAIPLAIMAVLAFTTPNFADTGKLIYAYITFILFMFFYSFVNIPYTSLMGVISPDSKERTSVSSFKFVGAYLAGLIVSFTALKLAAHFGGGDSTSGKGWSMTMIVYAVFAVVFFAITFLSTRERVKPIKEEKSSVKTDLKDLMKNDAWIILFAVTILFILFTCIRTSVTTHYFKYFVGVQDYTIFGTTHHFTYEDLASAFNGIGQAFSLIGVFLVPWFAGMSGKKRAVSILLIIAMVCTGAFYFFKPDNLLLIFVFQIFGSVTGGPISAILWSMYADTADYSEWKTGNRATGLIYSASIMSNKIGWAVGAAIVGLLLGAFGFKANEVQNMDVQGGLKSMMSLIPVAFGTVALILLYFYKLDEKKIASIKIDLDARRAAKGIETEE
ncbi:MAG TPA: MFS transporter [Prolixibacteraceae bacterium]|nr:MFS transporter [Prolixibacteraceae bacterium]